MNVCLSFTEDLIHAVLLGGASSSTGALFKGLGSSREKFESGKSRRSPWSGPTKVRCCRQDPPVPPRCQDEHLCSRCGRLGAPVPAASRPPGITLVPSPLPHSQNSALPLLLPAPGLLQRRNRPEQSRNALLPVCGTVRSGLEEMYLPSCFKCFFNFSAKEFKILDTCLGVRNLCTVSHKVQNQLPGHQLFLSCGCLHSCGCPTT